MRHVSEKALPTIRQPFAEGWTVRPKANEFAEMASAVSAVPVTLPHDALIASARDASLPDGAPTGYFAGDTWDYRKTFFVPEEYTAKRVRLESEGVYRSALVYVNGDLAGQWAAGYTGFSVALDDFLRYGQDNQVRVEARAHRDSRWYSGAGIHRPVHLIVAGPAHVTLDGVQVTTPDIDAERAVVLAATTIENEGARIATVSVETGCSTTPDVLSRTTPLP